MAEQFHDVPRVGTLSQKQSRPTVAQVVETETRQPAQPRVG
jgi:hypothetical protein